MTSSTEPTTGPATAVHFGWVSLFQDLGSKMVVPIVPLYLTVALGASPLVVGIVDGVAAATVAVVAPLVGRVVTPRRAPGLVRLGYGLSSLAKVALLAASTWLLVLGVRVVDRAGKGIRDAPRDLLLAGSRPDRQASAFGIQQAMDKLGGAIGPLIGLAVYRGFDESFDAVFAAAFLPCAISVILLLRRFDTTADPAPTGESSRVASLAVVQRRRIAILGLGAAATVPVSLLIVRGLNQGADASTVLIAFALLRTATAVFAIPGGVLADRFGAGRMVALGQAVLAAAFLVALVTTAASALWFVLVLVGVSDALLRAPTKAWVLQSAGAERRGAVLGAWNGTSAGAGLIAGLAAGLLWGDDGTVPLIISAATVSVAAVAIWAWRD
ncbi:MAG: MFS transporter [Actinomycetota bacterium]